MYDQVLYTQAIERTAKKPTRIKQVDVRKSDGQHRSGLVAEELIAGVDQAMYAAIPPMEALQLLRVTLAMREQERRSAQVSPDDHNISIMIHVDVHRAYFCAQAKPDTKVEEVM